MVCNASVIIPLIARLFSSSEVFHDDTDSGVVTIGGSGGKRRSDTSQLKHLSSDRTVPTPVVRVDVTVDIEHQNSWDHKTRVSLDGEFESYDAKLMERDAGFQLL